MNKLIALALPIGLALASSPAFAKAFSFSGNICQPVLASAGCVEPGQWGAGNTCSTTATVECPLPLSSALSKNVTQVYFTAFDRNGAAGADVSCTVQRTDTAGAVLWSSTLATSGNSSASQMKVFSNLAQPADFVWKARCTIPGTTASGFSHLTMFEVLTNE